jgi:hypothetical protein
VAIIHVRDINGAPLDGIVLLVTDPYPERPDEEVTTGDKGPGQTEALLWGEHWVKVVRDVSGTTYTSETVEHLDCNQPPAWDLKAVGECDGLTDEECEQRRSICWNQNSYELVFQRQW